MKQGSITRRDVLTRVTTAAAGLGLIAVAPEIAFGASNTPLAPHRPSLPERQGLPADLPDLSEFAKARPGNFVWMYACGIVANVIGSTGDFVPLAELNRPKFINGSLTPAYLTAEKTPLYVSNTDLKAKDEKKICGMVERAFLDEPTGRLLVVAFIDAEGFPEIARGVKIGLISGFNFEISVTSGVCSVCRNDARTESDQCYHMKYKVNPVPPAEVQALPVTFTGIASGSTSQPVVFCRMPEESFPGDVRPHEELYGLQFLSFALSGNPVFHNCGVLHTFDARS